MTAAFVYTYARTPFGRHGGALAGIRPDDLAATAISATLARSPRLDRSAVDEVWLGNSNGAGEENRNVARMAALLAGLPVQVPASTVNRLCGSSLDAALIGSRQIEVGEATVVLTGGVESMTRAPWVLPKPSRPFPAGDITAVSTAVGWRLVNPQMPAEWAVSNGECNEQLAERLGIDRDRQDEFARTSHRAARSAWEDGFYGDLVTPVGGVALNRDESIRTAEELQGMSSLRPSFRPNGTITAGNSSPLNDGAAAVLLGSESAADLIGVGATARIAGRGTHAVDPREFGIAPVEAAAKALKAAGITWSAVEAVELNEAFAAQSLACIDAWGIDPAIVNNRGGALAIGHPLGASGARILATLAERLKVDRQRWGVAAICIGVGQGLAVVLENVATS